MPLAIWLATFLAAFGLIGMVAQSLLDGLVGWMIPAFLAALVVAFPALLLTRAEAGNITIKAEAKKLDLLAQAEGQRAIVEADNAINAAIQRMKVDLARLEAMPKIIAEMVRPAEKIDSIKIHHVSGMGGASGDSGNKSVVNQALDSILGMAVQLPAMKKLGEELGFSLENGRSGVIDEALRVDASPTEVAQPAKPRGKSGATTTKVPAED